MDPRAVVAVMPSHGDVPPRELVDEVLSHIGGLVIVDDGSEAGVARQLDALAAETPAELVRLPERRGKGSALRAGFDHVLASEPPVEAVLVVDADGQHPASAIPAFLAAARDADVVIGDRFGDLRGMPLQRRVANRFTQLLFQLATGRRVRDTQNGMRLLRRRAAASFPPRGYEAAMQHLTRVLREALRVACVHIPTIYAEERSKFRAGRDSVRVLWALLGPTRRDTR